MKRSLVLVCLFAGCEACDGEVLMNMDAGADAIEIDAMDAPIDVPDVDAGPPPLPLGLILPFDGACPTGFTERVDLANKYLRGHDGDASFGETGGSTMHTHTIGAHGHSTALAGAAHTHQVTLSASAQVDQARRDDVVTAAGGNHTHTVTTSVAGGAHAHTLAMAAAFESEAAPNDPMFREVVLCEVNGEPTVLPATAIVLESAACPASWTSSIDAAGRLLRGHDLDGNIAEIGGTSMHSHRMVHDHGPLTAVGGDHTHIASAASPSTVIDDLFVPPFVSPTTPVVASATHTHSVTVTGGHTHTVGSYAGFTDAVVGTPEYRELLVCHASSAATLPLEALALSTGPCPAGWIEILEFRNRFLSGDDGDAAPGEVGGGAHTHSAAHDHGTSGTTSHNGTPAIGTSSGSRFHSTAAPLGTASDASHTHAAAVSSADAHAHPTLTQSPDVPSVEALPPFVEVVVCQRE